MLFGVIMNSACAVFGVRNEETPDYDVVKSDGDYEIRSYDAYIVAKTTVKAEDFDTAQNKGFRILADYIFGSNQAKEKVSMTAPVTVESKSEKIAMTAPVTAESEDSGSWTITFMMPSKYTMETLPEPDDSRVEFDSVAPQKVAVLRFSGSRSRKRNEKKASDLKGWIDGLDDYKIVSDMTSAGYDPPWTIPFFRRNEVMFDVEKK